MIGIHSPSAGQNKAVKTLDQPQLGLNQSYRISLYTGKFHVPTSSALSDIFAQHWVLPWWSWLSRLVNVFFPPRLCSCRHTHLYRVVFFVRVTSTTVRVTNPQERKKILLYLDLFYRLCYYVLFSSFSFY